MAKSNINSRKFQNNASFYEENVLQVNIQNYSAQTVYFTWNNFERSLPPVDATLGIPAAPFVINDNGNEFEVRIDFRFTTTGNVIVDYSKLKK